MSLVTGDGSQGLCAAVPLNFMQVGTPGRPAQPVYNANPVFTQVPLNWNVPVVFSGGVEHPAPLLVTAPAVNTFVNIPGTAASQPDKGTWVLGFPSLAPPPVVQLIPVMSPVNAAPPPQGAYEEGGLTNFKANPPENYLSKPDSVYGNFRRWQHIKTLVRRHLPQTPDVEAFSCFLIPVLRSLARRRPTMNVEEGLWRGLQEWKSTSNFDRMIFFEMADKFTEFESAEEMENPRLEMIQGFQFQPPATLLTQGSPGPPAPEVVQQPVCIPMKTESKANPAHPPVPRCQQSKTEAPIEIPPEAMQEYMDIMDWLERFPRSNTGEPAEDGGTDNAGSQQERRDLHSDPRLLSYADELCSHEDFVKQVEAVINPQFVSKILSPKPEMDMLALTEELEKEEELTVDQLLEKRHLALKKKQGLQEPLNHGEPQTASSASLLAVSQSAERDDCGPQRGVSSQKYPSQISSSDHRGHDATNAKMLGPKPATALPGNQWSPSMGDTQPTVAPGGPGSHTQGLGSRCAVGLTEASPTGGPHGSVDMNNEDAEELPSLSFLLSSQFWLVPWRLSHSLGPLSGLSDAGGVPQPSLPQKRSLSSDLSPSPKSKTGAIIGGLTHIIKMPSSGPDSKVSEVPPAIGLACSSQPQKRKCELLSTQKRKRKKRH